MQEVSKNLMVCRGQRGPLRVLVESKSSRAKISKGTEIIFKYAKEVLHRFKTLLHKKKSNRMLLGEQEHIV
jgi:hypothetical protein